MKPTLFLIALFALGTPAFGQNLKSSGQDRGGGRPKEIIAAEVKLLIQGRGLKDAISKYLETIKLDQIQNAEITAVFSNAMMNNALLKDINMDNNYLIQESCRDSYNQEVPASTQIGAPGSTICFDVNAIAQEFQNISSEEIMIRLAALAIHEHIHHFQNVSAGLKFNEDQAYRVSAYVQMTAKVMQAPVLKWDPNPTQSALLQNGSYIYSDEDSRCGIYVWTSPDKSLIKLTPITHPKTLTGCDSGGAVVYRKDTDGKYRYSYSVGNKSYSFVLDIYDEHHLSSSSETDDDKISFLEFFSPQMPAKPKSFPADGYFYNPEGALDTICGAARAVALNSAQSRCAAVYGSSKCKHWDSYISDSSVSSSGVSCSVVVTVRP